MNKRREYEITTEQLNKLLDASKPTPVMYLSGGQRMFNSPQENANRAWKSLGDEMGFDYMSVAQVEGKPETIFTALEKNNA